MRDRRPSWWDRTPRLLAALVLAGVIATEGRWAAVSAEDAPAPPPAPPLERLFAPAKEALEQSDLPPFLKDTDLRVHFRSYYFNRTKPDDSVNEAWTFGGWISYQSGWLFDTFAMGATLYGSAALYAPDDRTARPCSSPDRRGTTSPGRRGARCATRSTPCSRATVNW